jgi:hypothetical protein
MTNETVVKLVSDALKKHTHPAFDAEILIQINDLRQRDDWWYVPVYPSKEVKSIYGYYDVLAMAAEELQNNNLKIQLIPV